MKRIGLWLILLFWSGAGVGVSVAQDGLTALARLEPGSIIRDAGDGVEVTLQLSQAVPYRVYQLADPWRVVFEFSEVEFSPISHGSLDQSDAVLSLRSGAVRPGWSRLVMELRSPMTLAAVQQETRADLGAVLSARLAPEDEVVFRENARLPDDLRRQPVQQQPILRDTTDGPLRIMVDPGHGGIDPGAEAGEVVEAELMLSYARALKEALMRTGMFEVEVTRDDDVFVPLETRVSMAHAFRADLFLSLHADVVLEGQASGAAIYTLSEEASDIASAKLAERHSREDLLAGVDLTQQDDGVAFVLMDMARTDNAHRTDRLADSLVEALGQHVELYKKPRLEAGFSVLKAPDIPSVLIELGFMSSKHDLKKLTDEAWREQAVAGIVQGIIAWAEADAAEKALRKK